MIKKFLGLSLLAVLSLVLVACQPTVTLEIKDTEMTVIAENEITIPVTSDDEKGLSVISDDETILEIRSVTKDEIVIEGHNEGVATVTITSKSNDGISKEIKVTVRKNITITSNSQQLELIAGDDFTVEIDSNDPNLTYLSSSKEVFVVDSEGNITAKSEGTATLTVTSEYNTDVTYEITVTVLKKIEISVDFASYNIVEGMTSLINVTANDDVTYLSSASNIFTVTEEGLIEGVSYGEGYVRITSVSQPDVYKDVPVSILKYTTGIEIGGSSQLIVDMSEDYTITSSPLGAFEGVSWESSDESVFTVDSDGVVTGIGVGNATLIATSTLDDTVTNTFDIEVINVLIVDHTKQAGDTYDYNGVSLAHGTKLFTTINDALTHATEGTKIIVSEGTYKEDITLSTDAVTIDGESNNVLIEGVVTLDADHLTITNITFTGTSSILSSTDISNVTLDAIKTTSMTNTDGYFISLSGVEGIVIINSTFGEMNASAILIDDFIDGLYLIKDNSFDSLNSAIKFNAKRDYALTTEINILWNSFSNVESMFVFDMIDDNSNQKDIEAYARFNTVDTEPINPVITEAGSLVDFTLNYWGTLEPDYSKYLNVTEELLRGYYTDADSVMKEEDYDIRIPISITITNPITELMIGDDFTVEYSVLPMDMVSPYIKFITSNPSVLGVSNSGVLTPKVSGVATITVRSGYNSKLKTTMELEIITTPGIELSTDHIMNNLLQGDDFNITATTFPATSASEPITFTSSNQSIAVISSDGHVDVVGTGEVTLRASFTNDPAVFTEYTVSIYESLDTSTLMDYITSKQVSYTTRHDWIAYGYQGNYNDTRYESVSRYYFDDVEINTSKMVPVFYAIRPGEPMDTISESVRFNEENIHWVVVHDTASSATGSNALAHANYLYNNAANENELWVSWHYTIDDTYVYQHLPEAERAFHAGDGSTPVGGGSYFGGGNRNGVGIEMSINQDGDMYRTWQRTAKLVVDILVRNNLPTSQQAYHNDFSGKDCPRTLRNAGLIPLFEEFVEIEYYVRTNHPGAVITMESNNPDYLDNYGRVIQLPDRAMTVSYTITVTENGVTESRVFYAYLPGTVH